MILYTHLVPVTPPATLPATPPATPPVEQVAEDSSLLRRETAEVNRIRSLLELAKVNREKFTAGPLRDEVETWMHAKIMHRTYEKGHRLWNGGKFNESRDMLASSVAQINATKFMETYERRIYDAAELAKDLGPANVVPFGISGVDNHLFPGNPRGSLRKGDQTVIMSAVNVGKSTTLITVIVHNVRAGKHVLYVTHEGHRSDLRLKFIRSYLTLIDEVELKKIFPDWNSEQLERGKRFFRTLASKPLIDIVNFLVLDPSKPKNPEQPWRQRLDTVFNFVQQFITFMPIHKPGMEVEEITPIIERQQELRRDNHKDEDGNPKGYDLFVCDYPGVLTSRQNSKGQLQWRHTQQIVYVIS